MSCVLKGMATRSWSGVLKHDLWLSQCSCAKENGDTKQAHGLVSYRRKFVLAPLLGRNPVLVAHQIDLKVRPWRPSPRSKSKASLQCPVQPCYTDHYIQIHGHFQMSSSQRFGSTSVGPEAPSTPAAHHLPYLSSLCLLSSISMSSTTSESPALGKYETSCSTVFWIPLGIGDLARL